MFWKLVSNRTDPRSALHAEVNADMSNMGGKARSFVVLLKSQIATALTA